MSIDFKDHGKKPYVVNIEDATLQNENYRTTIWTGEKLQVTVMTIQPNDDIGLEVHHGIDQFIRIEEGDGVCVMGDSEDDLYFKQKVSDDDTVFVPADKWHNIINVGDKPRTYPMCLRSDLACRKVIRIEQRGLRLNVMIMRSASSQRTLILLNGGCLPAKSTCDLAP